MGRRTPPLVPPLASYATRPTPHMTGSASTSIGGDNAARLGGQVA